jgi:hypothetical protein
MRLLPVAVLVLVTACASTPSSGRSRSSDLLTLEDIEASDQSNAYDLIRVMRPQWLRTRGPSSIHLSNPIVVYLDGNRLGDPDALTTIPLPTIEEIRFYSPMEAQRRWGLNHTNGAIAVRTRGG